MVHAFIWDTPSLRVMCAFMHLPLNLVWHVRDDLASHAMVLFSQCKEYIASQDIPCPLETLSRPSVTPLAAIALFKWVMHVRKLPRDQPCKGSLARPTHARCCFQVPVNLFVHRVTWLKISMASP